MNSRKIPILSQLEQIQWKENIYTLQYEYVRLLFTCFIWSRNYSHIPRHQPRPTVDRLCSEYFWDSVTGPVYVLYSCIYLLYCTWYHTRFILVCIVYPLYLHCTKYLSEFWTKILFIEFSGHRTYTLCVCIYCT